MEIEYGTEKPECARRNGCGDLYRIFIDGSAGTTGLKLAQRLEARDDLAVIQIPEERRKDLNARLECIGRADISFLCLPDDASKEICAKLPRQASVLDTSTAHRTQPDWVYGLPELSKSQRERVASARRVAVPGCHATGFLTLAAPLVKLGIVPADYPFCAHSVTGYSGGGKRMIAQYESADRPLTYQSPRQYALGQHHKHLPEMQAIAGLAYPPIFNPIVADFFSGMAVTVPLHVRLLPRKITPQEVAASMADYYAGQRFITVHPYGAAPADGTLDANSLAGTNQLEIFVFGTEEQIVLVSRFDNLGKGASGAAVQCMNLMLGLPEDTGL